MEEEFKNPLPHAIEIFGTMNQGYIMQVGCARFAYGDTDEMLDLLKRYLDDPEGMVKKYNDAGKGSGRPVGHLASRDDQCETESEPQQPEGNL